MWLKSKKFQKRKLGSKKFVFANVIFLQIQYSKFIISKISWSSSTFHVGSVMTLWSDVNEGTNKVQGRLKITTTVFPSFAMNSCNLRAYDSCHSQASFGIDQIDWSKNKFHYSQLFSKNDSRLVRQRKHELLKVKLVDSVPKEVANVPVLF